MWENETEFVMYRLCYYLLVNNQPAIASYLRSLTPLNNSHSPPIPTPPISSAQQSPQTTSTHSSHRYTLYTPFIGAPRLLQHLVSSYEMDGVYRCW